MVVICLTYSLSRRRTLGILRKKNKKVNKKEEKPAFLQLGHQFEYCTLHTRVTDSLNLTPQAKVGR